MTPSQTLLLWCLLGRGGQSLQKDIRPEIKKADREALVAGGYVTSAKGKRAAITVNVEDKGWRWASEHLGDPLPDNYRVLQDWLTLVHRQLNRSDTTLADFIGPLSARAAEPQVAKSRPKRSATRAKARAISAPDLRARIEVAYLTVTSGRAAEAVPLVKIRAELADLDRSVVDEGLKRILKGDRLGKKKAKLIQNSDPRSITADDHTAAFSPAGDPYHILWIQP